MRSGKHAYSLSLVLLSLSCLFIMLVAAGCGAAESGASAPTITKAPPDKQVYVDPIRFGGLKNIGTFDPALATDSASITAIDMVFTGLVTLDDQLMVQDQLAASHYISSDGLTYTFLLRPGVKFSDGTPLTSSDVAYSLDRALDPVLKSRSSPTYLGLIKDADKRLDGQVKTLIGDSLLTPNAQTIKIVLSHKAAYFLDALTYPCAFVVEKSIIEKYGNAGFTQHLIDGGGGAGPFVVSAYTPGKAIEFVPNENYYGPHSQLRKVVFPFFASIDAEYAAYKTNQIDTAQITADEIASAQALPEHQYQAVPQLVITYVAFNYLVKPFDNIHIRQAFALALNKDKLAYTVAKGIMIPTNHLVPQGMSGYDPNLLGPAGVKSTAGDLEKARQLLQQGLKEEGISKLPPITFVVATNGNATNREQVAAMLTMWRAIGINISVTDLNFLALNAKVNATLNNPEGLMMWRLNWVGDYPDPQNWLTLQFGKGSLNNQSNYGQNSSQDVIQQQAVQQLMAQADADMNQDARMALYNQAEQQLVNDVARLPIDQAILPYVVKPCVTGHVYNAAWLTPPNDWANVFISTNPACANASE
jgi:oligopeptide transport system substrate-binding protein